MQIADHARTVVDVAQNLGGHQKGATAIES
jgi:hypothetical protein